MQRNTLVLLAIAILLSLGIWLYTAQVVMAPQTHQAPYTPIRPAPTATVTCMLFVIDTHVYKFCRHGTHFEPE